MFYYFSSSIVRKINAIILSILSLGLICFAIVIATSNYRSIVLELQEKASNTLELSRISLVEQIWTMNQVGLDDIRDAIMLDRDVVAIKVRDETKEVLTKRFREKYQDSTFEKFQENKKLQYQEIKVLRDGETIGDIQIVLTKERALTSVKNNTILIAGFTLTLIFVLGLVISYIGFHFLKRPVHSLQKSAVELAGGNLDEEINTSRVDELGVLARSFSEMRDSIRLKISDLQQLNQISENLANVFERKIAFPIILETIAQKIESDLAAFYLLKDEKTFELKAEFSTEKRWAEGLLKEFEAADKAIDNIVFYKNAEDERVHIKADSNKAPQSLLCVPLIEDRKQVGVMFFSGKPEILKYEDADKEFVETVSRIATVTLSRIEMMDVIAEHNHTLEQKVLNRTAAIRDLMDNTGQGFLSFGTDYKINKEYSKACESFFQRPIFDLDVLEVLFGGTETNIESIKELFVMVFSDITDLEMLKEMIPREIQINDLNLSLDYKHIKPVDQTSEAKIMVILTDVTREKNLAQQIQVDEERKTIIVKIALDKDGFVQFLRELETLYKSIYDLLVIEDLDKIDVDALFRYFHTIKGGCASYGFKKLAHSAHEIESGLEPLRKGKSQITKEQVDEVKEQTQKLEEMLHSHLEELNEILPPEERNTDVRYYRVAEEKILHLESFLTKAIGQDHISQIKYEIEALCRQPVASVFRKYASSAEELSLRMNKEVDVKLLGTQLEVSYNRFEMVFSTLIHLVRNSVDHGLETPAVRTMLGKTETGSLTIEAQRINGSVVIRISDDGAGIDPVVIKDVAIKKGLVDEKTANEYGENEAIDLIFAPGFSTNEEVTDISGRGVGMDALKSAVEDLNGNINVITQINKGTTFEVSIPDQVS